MLSRSQVRTRVSPIAYMYDTCSFPAVGQLAHVSVIKLPKNNVLHEYEKPYCLSTYDTQDFVRSIQDYSPLQHWVGMDGAREKNVKFSRKQGRGYRKSWDRKR